MKKLIAQRPILYMGRTYERGDTLPAHDGKMVAAWLRAGSAAWSGQESRQDAPGGVDGQEPAGSGNPGQNGQETPERDENGGDGEPPAMLTGHLDAAQLERMTKADLLDLAEKLGVDVLAAKNQKERAAILAAVEVQAHANDPENGGGAQ